MATIAYLGCDDDDVIVPPDSTVNNTLEDAWDVSLPYSKEFTLPATDPAEVFRFGIGAKQAFCTVIVIKVKLLEPAGTPFYLKAELLSDEEIPLVTSRDAELVPAAWVASRANQLYYLRITPVGDPDSDRYRYSLDISSSTLNDPFEPDDDTASATPIIPGIQTTGAYLCSPFADSLVSESMEALPDFYSVQLENSADLYVTLSGTGSDSDTRIRLYDPAGALAAETADTIDTFVLSEFQAGKWYVEVTEASGFYPQYADGEVGYNYLSPYLLLVTQE
jgi:hypothetical protein